MDTVQQRAAAKQFVTDWTGHGDEKQDAQNFWRQLLQKVFGVEDPEKAISFEYKVKNDQTNTTIFIDGYIHNTSVLIEQKSFDVDLSKGYRQSDAYSLPAGTAVCRIVAAQHEPALDRSFQLSGVPDS